MSKKMRLAAVGLALVALALSAGTADAFMQGGCGGGECRGCHTLSRKEATKLLAGFVDNVTGVTMGPVPGLYLLEVTRGGRSGPVYMDFSKKYLIAGQVISLPTREDVTGAKTAELATVDASSIPLTDALIVGNPLARKRVIVFSDPDCHFCAKLHEAIRTVAAKRPDVAFYIKLYSRTGDPATIAKVRAIVCGKSLSLLEDAYAGKALPAPAPSCGTAEAAETAKIANELSIRGTPTFILPDGRMVRGYRDADTILRLLTDSAPATSPSAGTNLK